MRRKSLTVFLPLAVTGLLALASCSSGDSTSPSSSSTSSASSASSDTESADSEPFSDAESGETTAEAPQVEDTLTIYSAEVTAKWWAEQFNAKFPNVEVTIVDGSSGEMIAKAASERERPQADLLAAGGDPEGANPGLLRKNDGLDLTANDPIYTDPSGFLIPIMKSPVIFIYNEDALNGDAVPTTWAELADPKWKGRIQMGNPLTSEAAYKAISSWWAIGGWDLVEAIAKNAIITAGSSDCMPAVSNGEAAIGVGLEQLVYQWTDGEKIKAGYPTDGVVFHTGTWFLVNNSPHPNAAEAFMQNILTVEEQNKMAVEFPGMRPINVNADGNPDIPAIGDLNTIPFPAEAQAERPQWNEKWEDIMTSIG